MVTHSRKSHGDCHRGLPPLPTTLTVQQGLHAKKEMIENREQDETCRQNLEKQLWQVELQCQQWKEHLSQKYNIEVKGLGTESTLLENESTKASQAIHQLLRQEQLRGKLLCQLREARVREESDQIIQAWQDKRDFLASTRAETPPADSTSLFLWYFKLIQASETSKCENEDCKEQKGKLLNVSDKTCYNLKYETAMQSQSSGRIVHREEQCTGHHHQHPGLPMQWKELLTFSTRRNGLCVTVMVGKYIRNSSKNEQTQLSKDPSGDPYLIQCDPFIEGVDDNFTEHLLQKSDPVAFIQESIWPGIDSLTN